MLPIVFRPVDGIRIDQDYRPASLAALQLPLKVANSQSAATAGLRRCSAAEHYGRLVSYSLTCNPAKAVRLI